MKQFLKKILRIIFGEYSIYYIYHWALIDSQIAVTPNASHTNVRSVDKDTLLGSSDPLIRDQIGYIGAGSLAYGVFERTHIIGVCFYWYGDRYRTRNFLSLNDNDAKLVQIVMSSGHRGQGFATELISKSSLSVATQGFTHLYARIWHSNVASIRAFERSGWRRTALIFEVNPARMSRPLRVRIPLATV